MTEKASATQKSADKKSPSDMRQERQKIPEQSFYNNIQYLQRSIGNQGVLRFLQAGLLQAKLNISQPDSPDEQEADRVADQVMQVDESDDELPLITIQVMKDSLQPKLIPRMTETEEADMPAEYTEKSRQEATELQSFVSSLKGRGQPMDNSTRTFMESRFGYDFNQVRVHTDARAAQSAAKIHARAYTVGTDIVFGAGRYTPDTSEGRHLLAHELTHVAQQTGGLSPALNTTAQNETRIDRAHENPGKKTGSNKPTGSLLPEGVNYQIQGSIVIVRTAWIAEDKSWNVMSTKFQHNKKIPELLRVYRQIGLIHWVTDEQIKQAAPRLGIEGLGHRAEFFGIALGIDAYKEFGPPPESDLYCMRDGDGLMIIIGIGAFNTDSSGADGVNSTGRPLGAVKASPQFISRILDAVEAFTGLEILPEIRERTNTDMLTFDFQSKAAVVPKISRKSCEKWFGAERWNAYLSTPVSETGGTLRGGKSYSETVTNEDRKWFEEWCKVNLGEPNEAESGFTVTRALVDALRKVDRHRLRERILGLLTRGDSPGGNKLPLTPSLIESLIARVEADEVRSSLGLEKLDKGGEKPLFDEPVQGRIACPQLLYPGREAIFYFQQESNRDAFKVPWVQTEWAIQKQEDRKVLKYGRIQYGELQGPPPFKYTFEEEGHFLVHVFVNHNFYWPAHFEEPVEVKSQSERLSEVEEPAYGNFGLVSSQDKLEGVHQFETSWSNELLGAQEYREGVKVVGTLPPEFKSMTFEERIKFLKDEIKRVTDLYESYQNREGQAAYDIKSFSENYLAVLKELLQKLNDEHSTGFKFFEARGAFLGRQQGIGDKSLKLVGSAKRDENQVTVNLHDFTHLADTDTCRFSGTGSDFDTAAENTFITLCKSYPPGRLSVRVEQLDADAVKPTGQFIHFELDTATAWKDIKDKVWDPGVQIAVNLGAAVVMVFVPASATVVFPVLIAYNATQTVDNLAMMADKGTLRWNNIAGGAAMIGLDLLPYAGQIKKFATIANTMRYVIDGVQIAGQMVIVTSDALQQLSDIRNQDISEISGLHQWIQETKKFNPSHPQLAVKEKELEEKIEQTRIRSTEIFKDLAISGAIMLVAPMVFNHIQGLTAKGDVDALIKEGLFVHENGVEPHYDPERGLIIGDKSMIDSLELECLGPQYAADMMKHHSDLAVAFDTSPENIKIRRDGKSVAVKRGKDGTVEITIPREMNIKEGIETARLKAGERPDIQEADVPKPKSSPIKEQGLESIPKEPEIFNEQGTLKPHVEEYPEGLVHLELNRGEAYSSYRKSIDADLNREAAIYVDPDNGEHIVVQGNREFVDTDWYKEPGMQRSWQLEEHYHPGNDTGARYASPDDYHAMMDPIIAGGDLTKPISTKIRWRDPASKLEFYTEIGYTPDVDPPFWIKYRDVEGKWQFKQFRDVPWNSNSEYEHFLIREGIPVPDGGASKPGVRRPDTTSPVPTPVRKTPDAKLPDFNRKQKYRLNQMMNEMKKHGMLWSDIGLGDANEMARFFSMQPTVDEGIGLLEKRLRSKLDIRTVMAEAQQPLDWNSRKTTVSSETDSTRPGPQTPEGQRLPRGTDNPDSEYGGHWGGERGEWEWYSDIRVVNELTGWKPIRFRKGFPDFRPWAKEQVFMRCTGIDDIDFPKADKAMAKRLGFKNKTAYKKYREANRLTWHHVEGGKEMLLVPRDIHENVPHQGGASDARAAAKASNPP